jgi:hypothetical protein
MLQLNQTIQQQHFHHKAQEYGLLQESVLLQKQQQLSLKVCML